MSNKIAVKVLDERKAVYRNGACESCLSASSDIAANLSEPINVRFYRVLTGYQMTETGREAAIATPDERMADYCVIGITSGRPDRRV